MKDITIKLCNEATEWCGTYAKGTPTAWEWEQKLVELVVEECRTILANTYTDTPLELCGPLLTLDKKLIAHFYKWK